MKRVSLGIGAVVVFGALLSIAAGKAVWQVVSLNAFVALDLPGTPPEPIPLGRPKPNPATAQPDGGPFGAPHPIAPTTSTNDRTPTLAPRIPTGCPSRGQTVYLTVEATGSGIEVDVEDGPECRPNNQ